MRLACSDASTHGAPVVSTPWTNIPTTTLTVGIAALPSPHLPLQHRAPEFIRMINILAAPRIIRRGEASIHTLNEPRQCE